MNCLISILSKVTPALSAEECEALFKEIAELLINNYAICVNDRLYRLLEIEFYYFNPNIDDFRDNNEKKKVTYPRITPVAQWFFHSSGVDLTFESNKNEGYGGGILIRKIVDDNGKITEGSLRCYWELFGKYTDAFSAKVDNLEYAKNILSDKMPDGNRREFYYTTKLGGHIGAYIDKLLPTQYITEDITWKLFVNADPYEREKYERYVKVNRKSADKVIDEFRKAKRIIEEKTGITGLALLLL